MSAGLGVGRGMVNTERRGQNPGASNGGDRYGRDI